MQKRANEENTGFILREWFFRGCNTSRSSVERLKVPKAMSRAMINPEFPERCAWPFQLLSCFSFRSSFLLSFSLSFLSTFFSHFSSYLRSNCCSFTAIHLAAFTRFVASNPTKDLWHLPPPSVIKRNHLLRAQRRYVYIYIYIHIYTHTHTHTHTHTQNQCNAHTRKWYTNARVYTLESITKIAAETGNHPPNK